MVLIDDPRLHELTLKDAVVYSLILTLILLLMLLYDKLKSYAKNIMFGGTERNESK
jgi:hypothetical protein